MRPVVVVLLCCMLGAPAAQAQSVAAPDAEAVARTHFDQGKVLATAGRYAEAYLEFEAGYQASHRPAFLFNMGEAARRMGDANKARAAYQRYLAAEHDGALAKSARRRLDALPPPDPIPRVPSPRSLVLPDPPPSATALRDSNVRVVPSEPVWQRWPFWAIVGGTVVASVVVTTIALRHDRVACDVGCLDLR